VLHAVADERIAAELVACHEEAVEAALSYLGVGVPRSTPSWGRELSDATTWFETAWWMMVFPGLFLLVTTLAFNLVGDGLRDALDPRAAAMSFRRQHQKRREQKVKGRAAKRGGVLVASGGSMPTQPGS